MVWTPDLPEARCNKRKRLWHDTTNTDADLFPASFHCFLCRLCGFFVDEGHRRSFLNPLSGEIEKSLQKIQLSRTHTTKLHVRDEVLRRRRGGAGALSVRGTRATCEQRDKRRSYLITKQLISLWWLTGFVRCGRASQQREELSLEGLLVHVQCTL